MILTKFANLPKYQKASEVPLLTHEDALNMYKQSIDCGVPFWQYLEMVQPTQPGDTLNAFERQLARFGIMTNSKPEMGLVSSTGQYFFQSDRPGSAILFPVLLQKVALWSKLRRFPDISAICATTRTITGTSAFQSLYIDDSEITGDAANGRRFAVNQKGHFPRIGIKWSEKTNSVTKHGVQLDWTYEFVRRASIDIMTTVVQRIMIQDQLEVFENAVDMAINGDGGPNSACVVKTFCKSTKASPGPNEIKLDISNDTAGAGVLVYEGWLKFIGGLRPYLPNAVFGNLNTLVKFVTMARPTMDPAAVITTLLEAKSQGTAKLDDMLFPNVTLYLAMTMPDNKLLAVDTQFAMERVIELGSDINEVTKVIQNQTEAMVISIADTASKIFNDAIQLLDFSAAPAA